MIRIATRISADWLDRPEDLKFIKQIGVDYVDSGDYHCDADGSGEPRWLSLKGGQSRSP